MLPDEECIYPPPVLRKDIMKLQLFIEKISLRILSYIVVQIFLCLVFRKLKFRH